MPSHIVAPDTAASGLLDEVRRRHRQARRARRASVRALREGQRLDAVVQAEKVIWDRADPIIDHLPASPSEHAWSSARAAAARTWADDRKLQRDLAAVVWVPGAPVSATDLTTLLAEAVATFNETMEATRRHRVVGQPSVSRQSKKAARGEAERRLLAVVAAINLSVTSLFNPDVRHIGEVAAGSLGR